MSKPDAMSWLNQQLEAELSVNHLEILFDAFPDKDWNWFGLAKNPNLTWEMVKKCPDMTRYDVLMKHPCITWDIIKNNSDYQWNFDIIIKNPNITWDIVVNNPEYGWDIRLFSNNPNITMDILQLYPPDFWLPDFWIPFQQPEFSTNALTWDMMLYLADGDADLLNIEMKYISIHPNITWDIVQNNPEYKWDYETLSANSNITWDIIQNNPDRGWCYEHLSENPNITIEHILNNLRADWNWFGLSMHPNITWDIIRLTLDLGWVGEGASENPNITIDMIQNCKWFNWGKESVLENPNITSAYIMQHDMLNTDNSMFVVSYNKFNKHPIAIKNIKKKYELKARAYRELARITNADIARLIVEFV